MIIRLGLVLLAGLGAATLAQAEEPPARPNRAENICEALPGAVSSQRAITVGNTVTVSDGQNPAHHANPAVAVNKDGIVAVSWNDRQAHENACYDFYVSASIDGGDAFLPNVKVSSAPTCAAVAGGNWSVDPKVADYPTKVGMKEINRQGLAVLLIATRFPSGGDTQGLGASPDGTFHAAWIDGSSGVFHPISSAAVSRYNIEGLQ